MRIGITYNLKSDLPVSSEAFKKPEDAAEEFDAPETIEAIKKVLAAEGHEIFFLGGDLGILEKIRRLRIDFVFNIAEGLRGRSREAHIPALLEMLGIPYSGSDPLALALTLDKALTKHVARSLSIATPDFWIVNRPQDGKNLPDRFPFFVKPASEGSSKGVRLSSKVANAASLAKELERLFDQYEGPVLVEEYIPGREFTVGVLGNESPQVLGIMEIAFRNPSKKDFCYALETKRNWKAEVAYHFPAVLDLKIQKGIEGTCLLLFQTLRLRDVARFDFRVSPEGKFFFLEVNPLPGLSPESGDLVILAQKKGWEYRDLISAILRAAFSRYAALHPSDALSAG